MLNLKRSDDLVNILLSPTHPTTIFKLSTYSKNRILVRQCIAVIILYWLRDYSLVKASIWTVCKYISGLSPLFLSVIESLGLFAVFELSKYVRRSE